MVVKSNIKEVLEQKPETPNKNIANFAYFTDTCRIGFKEVLSSIKKYWVP